MTQPEDDGTVVAPVVAPTVSTAPPPGPAQHRWHLARLPAHLGRARTSTVVMTVLFLAIGVLYLEIRPDPPGRTTAGTGSNIEQEAPVPSTPETTAPSSTVPEESPQPSVTPTPTGRPSETTSPEETGGPLPTAPISPADPTTGGTPG